MLRSVYFICMFWSMLVCYSTSVYSYSKQIPFYAHLSSHLALKTHPPWTSESFVYYQVHYLCVTFSEPKLIFLTQMY